MFCFCQTNSPKPKDIQFTAIFNKNKVQILKLEKLQFWNARMFEIFLQNNTIISRLFNQRIDKLFAALKQTPHGDSPLHPHHGQISEADSDITRWWYRSADLRGLVRTKMEHVIIKEQIQKSKQTVYFPVKTTWIKSGQNIPAYVQFSEFSLVLLICTESNLKKKEHISTGSSFISTLREFLNIDIFFFPFLVALLGGTAFHLFFMNA